MIAKVILITAFVLALFIYISTTRRNRELHKEIENIMAFTKEKRNEQITTQDIIDHAFTYKGVVAAGVYTELYYSILFVKIEGMPSCVLKQIKNDIKEFINCNLYYEHIRIYINSSEKTARKHCKVYSLEEHARLLKERGSSESNNEA